MLTLCVVEAVRLCALVTINPIVYGPSARYVCALVTPLSSVPSPKSQAYDVMVLPGAVDAVASTVHVRWMHATENAATGGTGTMPTFTRLVAVFAAPASSVPVSETG